jgi:hypothetical protein
MVGDCPARAGRPQPPRSHGATAVWCQPTRSQGVSLDLWVYGPFAARTDVANTGRHLPEKFSRGGDVGGIAV